MVLWYTTSSSLATQTRANGHRQVVLGNEYRERDLCRRHLVDFAASSDKHIDAAQTWLSLCDVCCHYVTLHIVSSAVTDTKMRIACYTVGLRLRCTLVAGPNSGECPFPFPIRTCIPRQITDSPCSQCNFRQPSDATLTGARENNQLGG